jgi:hypothetical protein
MVKMCQNSNRQPRQQARQPRLQIEERSERIDPPFAPSLIRVSGDFRAGTLPNCGLRPRSLLYCRGKISKNLTTGELPKAAMRLGFAQGSDPRLITPT